MRTTTLGVGAALAAVLALGMQRALVAEDAAVKVKSDVSYYDGADRDEKKHKLDLYVPAGKGPFPVLCWVHGGGWTIGDKSQYKHVGEAFAKRGILTAIVSYRLSPGIAHPEHVRDVARSLAWLKKHAKDEGGDPEALFVSGQSAGGHLAALVALDPTYLKEQGLTLAAIRGAAPMSGVYGMLGLAAFPKAFPEETRADAAPLEHVGKDKPPFLIAWGEDDPPNLRIGAKAIARKLEDAGVKVKTLECKERGHITIVAKIGSENDELTDAVDKFVKETSAAK
jgi:acetyl esterase/lipase